MVRRTWLVAVVAGGLLAGTAVFAMGQAPSQQDSTNMQRKLTAIMERGTLPASSKARPLRTSFSEREVNAYFKFDGKPHLPVGVLEPQIGIEDGGRIEARALVDIDAVRKAQPSTLLNIVAMFAGMVEVRATGQLQAVEGRGTLVIDRATVGGLPVPKSLLQELVTHYSKSPDMPEGFNLDKPFGLPAAIRTIEMQRGSATIVQ